MALAIITLQDESDGEVSINYIMEPELNEEPTAAQEAGLRALYYIYTEVFGMSEEWGQILQKANVE